jgi:hypothetical protein
MVAEAPGPALALVDKTEVPSAEDCEDEAFRSLVLRATRKADQRKAMKARPAAAAAIVDAIAAGVDDASGDCAYDGGGEGV